MHLIHNYVRLSMSVKDLSQKLYQLQNKKENKMIKLQNYKSNNYRLKAIKFIKPKYQI